MNSGRVEGLGFRALGMGNSMNRGVPSIDPTLHGLGFRVFWEITSTCRVPSISMGP